MMKVQDRKGAHELVAAIRRLAARWRRTAGTQPGVDVSPGCAFGAVVGERLAELERNIGEVKGRLNGLIFLVIGAVVIARRDVADSSRSFTGTRPADMEMETVEAGAEQSE